jgi:hypothetical protein
MKFIGSALLGIVVMAVTGSQLIGLAVILFTYFAIDRLDFDWIRK